MLFLNLYRDPDDEWLSASNDVPFPEFEGEGGSGTICNKNCKIRYKRFNSVQCFSAKDEIVLKIYVYLNIYPPKTIVL